MIVAACSYTLAVATDSDLALDPEEMRRLGHLVVDRLVDWSRTLDAALDHALYASGVGHVSSTVLEGEVTLRLCINSFRTTRRDVEIVVERLLGALEE